MTKTVKAIPDGYTSITPYIIVKNGSDAIEFYKKAFDAKEIHRMAGEDGKIMHAELQIGNARFMLADEFPEMNFVGPKEAGKTPVLLCLYVEDVDHTFDKAVKAGAKIVRSLQNQFYGDRIGWLTCPFGHSWSVSTHIEDLTNEEIAERAKTMKCEG